MKIAHTKLSGLDQEKVLSLVEPVLSAHRVDGVELVWRGDREGRVLSLTIEKPGSTRTGDGVTLDLCTEISRNLSAVFDETEVISGKYRLEVGSPGVDRPLYLDDDYRRFAGQEIKVKLVEPSALDGFVGQKTIRGTLFGLDDDGRVVLQTDLGNICLEFNQISSARLVFSWNQSKRSSGRRKRPHDSGEKRRTTKRSSEDGGR